MPLPAFITKYLSTPPSYRTLVKQNKSLRRQVGGLITQVQGATDITTNTDSITDKTYIGTPTEFNTYAKQVTQLGKLYDNIADWGCMIAKNVIDVRTAFSVGRGIKVQKAEAFEGSADEELAWVKRFMQFNSLDEEMPQEYAKEAEIDGKVLLRMLVDRKAQNIRVVHTPWRTYNYTITTPDYDFFNYIRAQYTGTGERKVSFDIGTPWFVYKRFGGGAAKVNEAPPKTAFILREMQDLDKAIVDWRKINRLFSAPTPVIYCPDKIFLRLFGHFQLKVILCHGEHKQIRWVLFISQHKIFQTPLTVIKLSIGEPQVVVNIFT